MNLRDISWYVGVFLAVSGILSFLPVPVALYYNEPVTPLLMRCVFFWFLGFVFMQTPRQDLDFRNAMLLVALGLVIVPFFGAIPFFLVFEGEYVGSLVDGYFEAVSGYTTSGLTLLPPHYLDPESPYYSRSLIFSRTLMEWTGGLGIVVLFLSLLARGGISTVFLYRVEGGQMIVPSIDHTSKIIVKIYLFYTFVGTTLLFILDNIEPVFALSTIMSVLSTGGFISYVAGGPTSLFSEIVVLVFLLLAAIPFTLDYTLLSGDLKKFFSHTEIRFGCYVLSGSIILFALIGFFSGLDPVNALHDAVILSVASITTAGCEHSFLESLPGSGLFLVLILMLVGGGAGSTAGGLKLIRFGVLLEGIRWFMKKLSLPESAVFPFKIGGNVFSDEELRNIALFFFIYVVLLFMGTFSLLFWGVSDGGEMSFGDAFFLSVSAQGNVGFSTVDISIQPIIVKLVLIFQMIAGRIEIFPILALVGYVLKRFQREVVELEHEVIEKEKNLVEKKKKNKEVRDRIEVMERIMKMGRGDDGEI